MLFGQYVVMDVIDLLGHLVIITNMFVAIFSKLLLADIALHIQPNEYVYYFGTRQYTYKCNVCTRTVSCKINDCE